MLAAPASVTGLFRDIGSHPHCECLVHVDAWHAQDDRIVCGDKVKEDAATESRDESAEPVLHPDSHEETLLRLADSVEQLSTHILSRAVVEAAQERTLPLSSAKALA
jgi:hypothetical protein